MSVSDEYEVIIVGGGPAGSTAASVLREHGRRVLVLEKEKFPRYHIGESLMPYCWFTLNRTGALKKIEQSHFPKKYSVQFVSTNGKRSVPFYFFQHYDHPSSTTWQVVRGEFDQMLLDTAREWGADVLEETKVTEILWEGGRAVGVRAQTKSGEELEFRAQVIIDATGRDALTVARNKWRIMDQYLKKVAVWTYYKGAARDPGLDEAATTVAYIPDKGWFWYIPLPNDIVGVGVVAEKDYLFRNTRDLQTVFHECVKENSWIETRLAKGEQFGGYFATQEFSYRSKYCAADGLVLVGDAFAFLDPVFSSGVFLALKSGEMAGDVIHEALNEGDVSAARFAEYGDQLCEMIEAMRRLVYAFYDTNFNFKDVFMVHPDVKPDLTDCLIGDLDRNFDALFRAVGEFCPLPEPLPHGRPLVEPACASSS